MSVYGPRNLAYLFLISLMCVAAPILAGPSEASRHICGAGLADVLRMLCNGKYQSNQANGAKSSGEIEEEVTTLTQECCSRSCPISYLGKYCASKPDMMSMFRAVSHLNSETPRSPLPSAGGKSNVGTSESTGGGGRASGGGRLANVMTNYKPFDLSPLLDTRLDDFEAVPYRQRRRR